MRDIEGMGILIGLVILNIIVGYVLDRIEKRRERNDSGK